MAENPKISVVTIVYNAIAVLEETILSVINQTYPNLEYIVIDGGSTDGCVEIIKKYDDKISYWVSEPDGGIYDAMNKGIEASTGEWINFMNAGDSFFNLNVLDNMFVTNEEYSELSDVFYGDSLQSYSFGQFIVYPWPLERIVKHLPFCHQSAFTRSQILKKYKFDCQYKLSADYNFFYFLYRNGYKFTYINTLVAIYDAEFGVSSKGRIKGLLEDRLINQMTYLEFKKAKLRVQIRFICRFLLPSRLWCGIIRKRFLKKHIELSSDRYRI